MTRRIVDQRDDAPKEVWLEWSVMADGSDPCLELEYMTAQPGAIRYVRADIVEERLNDG